MATFTLYSAKSYEGRKLRLYCTSSTNIANNTSTIKWTLYSEGGSSSYYTTGPTTVTINGVEVYYKGRVAYSSKTFPASKGSVSGSLTVTHNDDGKKSISVSLATAIYTSSVTTNSGTWTLDNIPRYATITSAPNFTDIQNPTIQYNNQAGTNATSLQACISLTGSSSDIDYRDISKTGTSYTFNLTEAERNVLRKATTTSNTRTVYFYIKTIISGNTFHQNQAVTLTIVNANPTFSVAYLDTNSTTTTITENNQQIIQNNSTLQINITNATALKYASLSSASVNVNGAITTQSLSGSSLTINIGTIDVSSNLTVPVTITDSRGNSTTINLTIQVLPWSLPNAIISLHRLNNYYDTTNLIVDANYSSLDNKNTITIQYQIKKVSDASYGTLTTIQDNVQTQFTADNTYEWNVKVILTDKLGTTNYVLNLSKGIPIVYFDRLLRSIGFNCFPQFNESVEVNGFNIDRNVMTARMENDFTMANADTRYKLPIDTVVESVGSKLTLSNNGIRIGSGINYVLASAQVYWYTGVTGTECIAYIYNNTTIQTTHDTKVSDDYEHASLPSKLIKVSEGDVISLQVYQQQNGGGLVKNYDNGTFLTVIAIG